MIKALTIFLTFSLLSACAEKTRYVSKKYRDVDGVSVNYSVESDKARAVINFVKMCSSSNCVTESENHFGWMKEPIKIRYITIFKDLEDFPIAYEVGVEPEEKMVVVLRLQEREGKDGFFDVSISSLDQYD
ncbi:hypothetical protein [Aliikangiella sp. G2MR2-5]|uniref:hypothetical protein n=1 Tax=Aliikangiella sp. G2MR2-5 TaxID=2788943 RepID=UPI001AED5D9A|nr:hypothetical protein [Aliikangiella sp. G2MR2-5]